MRTVSTTALIFSLALILGRPTWAATARARVCAEVISPTCVMGRTEVDCGRVGMQLPDSCLANAAVRFTISGAEDHGFSIILPKGSGLDGPTIDRDPNSTALSVSISANPQRAPLDIIIAFD